MEHIEKYRQNGYTVRVYNDENPEHPFNAFDTTCMSLFVWKSRGVNSQWQTDFDVACPFADKDFVEDFEQVQEIFKKKVERKSLAGFAVIDFGDWRVWYQAILFITPKQAEREGWSSEQAQTYLNAIAREITAYVNGEVYGYQITRRGQEIDSCWGFYDYDQMKENIESQINWHVAERNKRKLEKRASHMVFGLYSPIGLA